MRTTSWFDIRYLGWSAWSWMLIPGFYATETSGGVLRCLKNIQCCVLVFGSPVGCNNSTGCLQTEAEINTFFSARSSDITLAVNAAANHRHVQGWRFYQMWQITFRLNAYLPSLTRGGGGGVITANLAAKRSINIQDTPLDIFKDIWRYFQQFCGIKRRCFLRRPADFSSQPFGDQNQLFFRQVWASPSMIMATTISI